MLKVDFSGTENFVSRKEIDATEKKALESFDLLINKTGIGKEFTGFVELPQSFDRKEFARIKEAAKKIQSQSEVLIVIGIGGSYLGARAVLELLYGKLYNEINKAPIKVYFSGNSLSSRSLSYVLQAIRDKDFSVNVISKSGSTLEPAIAFRIFRKLLVERYGEEEANNRIYATTDKEKGILKEEADKNGWETFVVPDDIGGRYSVLSPVGLLPLQAAGIDAEKLLQGARDIMPLVLTRNVFKNPAIYYAALRNHLYEKGKDVEILGAFDASFHLFTEWWRQLFAESEGKEKKGIYPASCIFTTDLHSVGQFIQDGSPRLFETIVDFGKDPSEIPIPEADFQDGLDFLEGIGLDEVNKAARIGSRKAHVDGGTPYVAISLDGKNEENVGALIYFFEIAAGISAYYLGVNPFNQPGVEEYKQNMFALLGKKGYSI